MNLISRKSTLPVFFLVFILIACTAVFLKAPQAAAAKEENTKQYVYDNYGLLTEAEVTDLTDSCIEYSDKAKADIIKVTDDLAGKDPKTYLEDFYDEKAFGYEKEFGSAVIMLVNMEEGNRSVTIQGYGKSEYYVNNDRTEYMLDDIQPLLKDGEYKKAFIQFAKESAYYMNEEKGVKETPASSDPNSGNYYGESSYDGPSNYYGQKEKNPLYNTFVQLGIALAIGAVTVGIMAANSGGRMTTSGRDYMDGSTSGITANRDEYLRTTTTRVKKPTPQTNDGGPRSSGGGGISSGGHSHSGGSRGF